MDAPSGRCPDWYPPIRAARYAGIPVDVALGVAWSPIVQEWCLIAQAAENEAETALMKQDREAAERESER